MRADQHGDDVRVYLRVYQDDGGDVRVWQEDGGDVRCQDEGCDVRVWQEDGVT